ncbi:PIN domain nuclease [Sphingomonas floccifaciens]|uniref:PIN domain nuclease n=1 Tax=Sphingomonas floccifaciens TaxID=1844115 RepID=A0ABW4NC95_9SPHN
MDFFRGTISAHTDRLAAALDAGEACTGDLIVAEVLQGFRDEDEFQTAWRLMDGAPMLIIGSRTVAYDAASNYRHLRARGITVRKTIDTLIATRCILDDIPLLYSDRDFDPFVEHLGLQSALALS